MYVCKSDLDNYKNFIVSEVKDGRMNFEVEIRFKEPEKKIEITESEFEKIWDESLAMRTEIRFSKEFYNFKQKRFGNN